MCAHQCGDREQRGQKRVGRMLPIIGEFNVLSIIAWGNLRLLKNVCPGVEGLALRDGEMAYLQEVRWEVKMS